MGDDKERDACSARVEEPGTWAGEGRSCGTESHSASAPAFHDDLDGGTSPSCGGEADGASSGREEETATPCGCGCRSDLGGEVRKPVEEMTNKELGDEGERIARSYLMRRGMEVLACNWHTKYGEADIVAREDDTVVLVEVKTRLALGDRADEMPELGVSIEKQRRYRNMALCYLVDHPEATSIRFDAIAVNVVGERLAKLRHLVGAFSWDD